MSSEPRFYLICTIPRSGSNLLSRALSQTGLAGRPAEFFNRAYEPYASGQRLPLAAYIADLIAKNRTANGWFGCKIFYYQFEAALSGSELEVLFPGLRYLYLRRRDHLRQAVSFARAIQTRQWDSRTRAAAPPEYDGPRIERRLTSIREDERHWRRFFRERSIEPLELVYEDFVADYERTLIGVLRFLGVDLPPDFKVPPPPLQKQADAVSEAWRQRYLKTSGTDPDRA